MTGAHSNKPTRRVPTKPLAIPLIALLTMAALAFGGCRREEGKLPVVRTEIPFRPEGTLDFINPEGELLSTIEIEVAEGDSSRTRGLMERRSLPPRSGMLFIMDEDTVQHFWMRNTPLPLDILFVGADSQVVNIIRRTRPFSDSLLSSTGPAKYVVEVRAGFTEQAGINPGARLHWNIDRHASR